MATERAIALAAIAALSCSPVTDRCQAGTLLVTVTLAGATLDADALAVAIALDGGAPHQSTLPHAPGHAAGNVVVQFPAGYPRGQRVDVVVTASAAGVVVGSGSATITLVDSCGVLPLTVDDGGGAPDLAVAGDLGNAAADLGKPADLRAPPPDLVCPGGGVELCYNGIDDDCDGLADCADPDCFPVVKCVPTAPGWTHLVQESAAASCPTGTSGALAYENSDLTGGGCSSSCLCSPGGCSATLSGESCPSLTPTGVNKGVTNSSCTNIDQWVSFKIGAISGTASCSGSGSATPVTPPVIPTMRDCMPTNAPVVGTAGGCLASETCVPIGTHECVALAGANQACPGPYTGGGSWFPSFTDGRSCSCSCSAPAACSTAQVEVFDSTGCGGPGSAVSGDDCNNSLLGAKIVGNGCAPSASLSGQLTFNPANASTICCM